MKTKKNKLRKISLRKRKTSRRKTSRKKTSIKKTYKRRKTYKTKKNIILKGGAGLCPPDNQGFSQHTGECWNDSDMMIFCFTDGIKEKVQDFFTLIDDLDIVNIEEALYSLYTEAFDQEHKTNFNFLIPFNINYLDETKDDYKHFKQHAISYISNMYKRYKNLMPVKDDPLLARFRNLSDTLSRSTSIETTYACVDSNYLIQSINALSKIETDSRKRHGGNSLNKYFNSCIINYFIMTFNMTLANAGYITINSMSNINPELNDILAVSISSRDKNNKLHRDSFHANAFIICNQTPYFYDDNGVNDVGNLTFINQFDWKRHILKLKNKEINNKNFFNFPECRKYLKDYNMNTLFLFEMTKNIEYVKTNINSSLYFFYDYYSYNSLREEFIEEHEKALESLKRPLTDKEIEEFDFEKEFEDIDIDDELERRLNDINDINLDEDEEDEEDDLERRLRELKSN